MRNISLFQRTPFAIRGDSYTHTKVPGKGCCTHSKAIVGLMKNQLYEIFSKATEKVRARSAFAEAHWDKAGVILLKCRRQSYSVRHPEGRNCSQLPALGIASPPGQVWEALQNGKTESKAAGALPWPCPAWLEVHPSVGPDQ
jgi:hypothetical protein